MAENILQHSADTPKLAVSSGADGDLGEGWGARPREVARINKGIVQPPDWQGSKLGGPGQPDVPEQARL